MEYPRGRLSIEAVYADAQLSCRVMSRPQVQHRSPITESIGGGGQIETIGSHRHNEITGRQCGHIGLRNYPVTALRPNPTPSVGG